MKRNVPPVKNIALMIKCQSLPKPGVFAIMLDMFNMQPTLCFFLFCPIKFDNCSITFICIFCCSVQLYLAKSRSSHVNSLSQAPVHSKPFVSEVSLNCEMRCMPIDVVCCSDSISFPTSHFTYLPYCLPLKLILCVCSS